MDRRTEDQKLRGVVPVGWGGEVREVPTLKRGASRAWKERLSGALQEVGNFQVTAMDSISVAGNIASDTMLDLVLEYDQTHVLGDREWIDANVDDTEVYMAFRSFLDVSYPFVSDLRGALEEVRRLVGSLPSGSPGSTSSPSPSGGSTRRKSTSG